MAPHMEYFERLDMWHSANSVCKQMHRLSLVLPRSERNWLCTSLRNASKLVPIKIAEGAAAESMEEYIVKLKDSYRLVIQLKAEIMIAGYLQYIEEGCKSAMETEIDSLLAALNKMIKSLEVSNSALHHEFAYGYSHVSRN